MITRPCRSVLFLSTIALVNISNAQPFHPDTGSEWSEELWRYEGLESHQFVHTIRVVGDTVIQGETYKKLRKQGTNTINQLLGDPQPPLVLTFDEYCGSIRVDSTAQEWWVLLPGHSVPELLYRFDLEVGDVVTGTWGDCGGMPVVTSIDEVWFNGHARRRFILDDGFRHLIDGIGASSGLFGFLCQFFEEFSCLQAYNQGEEVLQVDGCAPITTGIPDGTTTQELLRGYPNPTQDQISFGTALATQPVFVHDMTGQLVHRSFLARDGVLDLSMLNTGTYLIRIGDRRMRVVRM